VFGSFHVMIVNSPVHKPHKKPVIILYLFYSFCPEITLFPLFLYVVKVQCYFYII